MNSPEMTSMQRVLTTLSHKEPDRVPFFLLLTMHGAKETWYIHKRIFFQSGKCCRRAASSSHVNTAHDCYYTFFYAAVEVEAWGGEVIYDENGPANAGEPIIRRIEDIDSFETLVITGNPALQKVLTTTQKLKERIGE